MPPDGLEQFFRRRGTAVVQRVDGAATFAPDGVEIFRACMHARVFCAPAIEVKREEELCAFPLVSFSNRPGETVYCPVGKSNSAGESRKRAVVASHAPGEPSKRAVDVSYRPVGTRNRVGGQSNPPVVVNNRAGEQNIAPVEPSNRAGG